MDAELRTEHHEWGYRLPSGEEMWPEENPWIPAHRALLIDAIDIFDSADNVAAIQHALDAAQVEAVILRRKIVTTTYPTQALIEGKWRP